MFRRDNRVKTSQKLSRGLCRAGPCAALSGIFHKKRFRGELAARGNFRAAVQPRCFGRAYYVAQLDDVTREWLWGILAAF